MFLLNNRYSVFLFVLAALILGSFASASASNDVWYQSLLKSNLNPPGYVFGIVWPILFFLMSVSAFRTYSVTKLSFFVQLVFNASWSWIFFFFQMPFLALLNIWLLIYLNILLLNSLYKLDMLAWIIYIPYIIWLLFASYLNLFIVLNN
ncbi:MAG: tryptophan-rich sensory protein [SAR86 cluster bacterium]|nr:tryptophan-rich sensory protein [SAR86 cluster bacterium]